MEKERVYKLRSRKTDNQLSPEQYRTYLDDFLIYFSVSSMILLLTSGYVLQDIMHYPLLESVKTLLTKPQILKASGEYKSVTTAIGTYISAIASLSWFVADKINKPSNLVEIKKDGSNYYVRNDGLEEYKKYQGDTSKGIVILEKDTDGVDLVLDNKTAELGFFVVGEAGSGKTVFIKRFLEHWVNMLEKCILHDPKLEFIEDLLNANVPVVLIAPWIGQSKVIDYAKLIWTDNDAKRDLLINLFVYSFAGFPNPKKPDFFKDGAVNVLIAITRKVVDKFKDKWSISDWMDTFLENQQVAKLKKLVDEFYPQISYLIDETNPKTTMSILASTVSTVVKLKMLADLWQYNTKYFDIKEWIYAKKPKYQFVALANHQTYGDIASSVIASFVNITSKLVLDPEYKKAYETDKLSGIHYTLDEFNSFGRYIDVVNFKNLPDLGRSAGIRTELFQQRYGQIDLPPAFSTVTV
ncbi:hypothetical protein CFB41_14340 [Burkholderia sp. AU33803]|uniref:type IV secretion system DNA-binding domain-containing protein n=1 Tax=Burkholderia sp. AU33803 TaxID=2015357 RepID=UPI000B7A756C|nr:type IV secretion system DNA-binding domain-containing protein [Burkholderia sp. AU33803]OXJ00857.1 hypothetical protein CFB41_14340 [Burkholderia sp. AU33803]